MVRKPERPRAAYPVAMLIEKIPSEARRLLLVHALRDIPPVISIDVFTTVMRLTADDPSERVRKAACETITIQRDQAHAKFARMKVLEALRHEIAAEERQRQEGEPTSG